MDPSDWLYERGPHEILRLDAVLKGIDVVPVPRNPDTDWRTHMGLAITKKEGNTDTFKIGGIMSCRTHYNVKIEQGEKYYADVVIHISKTDSPEIWTDATAQGFRNQVSVLKFLRRRTTIPVPKIISFDFTDDNPLGRPFFVTEFIDGMDTEHVFFHDGVEPGPVVERRRVKMLTQIASCMAQLGKFSFDQGGSLVFNKGRISKIATSDTSIPAAPPLSDEPGFDGSVSCTSGQEYLMKLLEDSKKHACRPGREGHDMVLSMFADRANHVPDGRKPFVLGRPSFDQEDFVWSETGRLLGVFGWEKIASVPRTFGNEAYPHFLCRDWDVARYEDRKALAIIKELEKEALELLGKEEKEAEAEGKETEKAEEEESEEGEPEVEVKGEETKEAEEDEAEEGEPEVEVKGQETKEAEAEFDVKGQEAEKGDEDKEDEKDESEGDDADNPFANLDPFNLTREQYARVAEARLEGQIEDLVLIREHRPIYAQIMARLAGQRRGEWQNPDPLPVVSRREEKFSFHRSSTITTRSLIWSGFRAACEYSCVRSFYVQKILEEVSKKIVDDLKIPPQVLELDAEKIDAEQLEKLEKFDPKAIIDALEKDQLSEKYKKLLVRAWDLLLAQTHLL